MKIKGLFLFTVGCVSLTPLLAQAVRTVPLSSTGMVYSPSRNELYVSVAAAAPQRPRTITVVHPSTGALGRSLPLEAEAWALAMSRDERYLYAGLVGGNIVRVDLRTFTRDLVFSTEATGVSDRVIVEIHVFPDRPTSIVASVGQEGFGPGLAALAVFDDGVMRPRILAPGLGIVRFCFGADSRTLWGYDGSNDAFRFYGLKIDGQGITVSSGPVVGLFFGFVTRLVFRDGLLYTSKGRVVDPVQRTIEGRYYSFEALFATSFAIDWERDRVYFATRSGYDFFLAEFDRTTFRRTGYFESFYGPVHVPWTPEQTVLCGPVLAMGGFGPENPFITLFPISLIQQVPAWQRPPDQPLSGEIRRIALQNNAIVYDAERNRILASTPNWSSTIGNSLVPIDPVRGRVGMPTWIGSDPWQMAISDNGQYLYAGLYSGWAVQRVRLEDLVPDLRIPLYDEADTGWGRRPTRVNEILAYPGRPESFVVARAALPGNPEYIVPHGVAVFDGPSKRPRATSELPYDTQIQSIQWDGSGRSLYGFLNFRELAVTDQGVELLSATSGVTPMVFSTDQMRCQYDLCFTPAAVIIDAKSQESLGRFAVDLYSDEFYWADFIAPDLDRGLVYFLADLGRRNYGDRRLLVEAYDIHTFLRVGVLLIDDAEPPTGLLIWGDDQLAVSTAEEVVLFPMSKLHSRTRGTPPSAAELRSPVRWIFPFIEENYRRFTGFAVSNPAAQPVRLRLRGYNADGDPNVVPSNHRLLDLQPRSQWARLGKEIFGADSLWNFWFELGSETATTGSFFLFQHGDGLDGAIAQKEPSRVLYFPRITMGENRFRGKTALNELYLVNPNGYSVPVKLTLIAKDRSPEYAPETSVWWVNLPAYGLHKEDLRFRYFAWADYPSAHVKVEVAQERGSLIGFQLIRLDDPETLVAFNAVTPEQTGHLYSAQLASGSNIFSNLKLINTADELRRVTLHAVAPDGSPLADPVTLLLPPGDSIESDAATLFGFPATSTRVGSLRAEADGPGLIGNLLFGDPENMNFAAALNLDGRPFKEAVFSHVANLRDFFTGLALYNPSEADAQVVLQDYTAEGRLSGESRLTLKRGERLSRLLPELVPRSAGQAGGYVLVRSSQPLVGQQLFGNSALTHLSAVPAQVIE